MTTTFEDRRGVACDQPPVAAPGEQGFQADPVAVDACLSARRSTRADLNALGGHERSQQGRRDARDDSVTGFPAKRAEVPPVRSYGVWRPVLGFEVIQKLLYRFSHSHLLLLLWCGWFWVMVDTASGGTLYQGISDYLKTGYRVAVDAIGGCL